MAKRNFARLLGSLGGQAGLLPQVGQSSGVELLAGFQNRAHSSLAFDPIRQRASHGAKEGGFAGQNAIHRSPAVLGLMNGYSSQATTQTNPEQQAAAALKKSGNSQGLATVAAAASSEKDVVSSTVGAVQDAAMGMMPRPTLIPGRWQNFMETIFGLTGTQNLTQQYFGIVVPTFTLLLCYNTFGLIPGGPIDRIFGAISIGLSVTFLLGITLLGFASHGVHFMSFFFPPGSPTWMAPLLVMIELISYSSRAMSLGFRLFANLLAGHALLKIMAGFALTPPKPVFTAFAAKVGLLQIVACLGMAMFVSGLEVTASFLQAYVFTLLSCYYVNDVLGSPKHVANNLGAPKATQVLKTMAQRIPK